MPAIWPHVAQKAVRIWLCQMKGSKIAIKMVPEVDMDNDLPHVTST